MSTTSRELWHRLWLLSALVVATTLALLGSYDGVHSAAVPLASSTAFSVREVDIAKVALQAAQKSAGADAASDRAGTSGFSTEIAVASQSLTRAAAADVTGLTGQQHIITVENLIPSYSDWIGYAGQVPSGSTLHAAYMKMAVDILGGWRDAASKPSIMGRINGLQQEQVRVVHRQTSFGWLLRLGWGLSVLLLAGLVAALAEAHRFHRNRFRCRWNRQFLAAGALAVAGSGVLGLFTWQTHTGLFHAGTLLSRRPIRSAKISEAGAEVGRRMADTGFRAAAAGWIVAGGLLMLVLIAWALVPRIVEYRLKASR